MKKITVLLADDHTLVRNGIKAMLESDPGIEVIGEADNGQSALEQARNLSPDILVIDIRMPVMNGLYATEHLYEYAPETKSIILSMHDTEDYVLQSLRAGAWGYLLKDIDKNEFIRALKQVNAGSKYFSGPISSILANQLLKTPDKVAKKSAPKDDPYGLTKREKEILGMVAQGTHNKEIAEILGKSIRTVETHRFNIMKKMDVNNAIDMVNKSLSENIV